MEKVIDYHFYYYIIKESYFCLLKLSLSLSGSLHTFALMKQAAMLWVSLWIGKTLRVASEEEAISSMCLKELNITSHHMSEFRIRPFLSHAFRRETL